MFTLHHIPTWLVTWLVSSLVVFSRYFLASGLLFLFFYILKRRSFLNRKIQHAFPKAKEISFEIKHSLYTSFIFGLVGAGIFGMYKIGITRIYTDTSQLGAVWFALSVILLIFIHDTWFYWIHRLMHHRKLYRLIHLVHHRSHNPTPWAALSFHPLEAVLEIAFLPAIVMLVPLHPIAIILFSTIALVVNIIGHLGYELMPAWFVRHPLLRWVNTSTHHNLHHKHANKNYGLYFNIWDRLMDTNHLHYEDIFEETTTREDFPDPRPQPNTRRIYEQ